MRKISAHYIFPISAHPIKNGILCVSDDGEIIDIIDPKGNFQEIASLEFYNGILVPGFVNAHCHLELSHLKYRGAKLNGLPDFIAKVIGSRAESVFNINDLYAADHEMHAEGIVAVGDIMNEDVSLEVKAKSKIHYHSFVEVFDVSKHLTERSFEKGVKLYKETISKGFSASLVPHAPYSVTNLLFEKIKHFDEANCGLYSVHNQETPSENLLYSERAGALFELMTQSGADFSELQLAETSLQSYSRYLPENNNILLIHNIFTSAQDIEFLKKHFQSIYFVLCLASNLIIENRLPDVDLLLQSGFPLCIGTDSYSSNTRLSVLEELKILSENFDNIGMECLLKMATLNGAKALRIDDKFGSFDKNKKPGINIIQGIDFEAMKLTPDSFVKKLV